LPQVIQFNDLAFSATAGQRTLLPGFAAVICRTFRKRLLIAVLSLNEYNARVTGSARRSGGRLWFAAVTIRQRCGKISRGLWHNACDSCTALAMVETFPAIRDLPAAAAGGLCPGLLTGWSHCLATRFG
jgi:hypothetical protein